MNVAQGIGNYCVDLLIQEELKNERRKQRNEEIKNKQKIKQQKVEHLKKLPRFLPLSRLHTIITLWMRLFEIW
jgi:hypothetical protein